MGPDVAGARIISLYGDAGRPLARARRSMTTRLGGRDATVLPMIDAAKEFAPRPPAGLAELGDAPLDPLAQLAGRLAGEREAEHLRHLDEAVRQQPDDAVRHGLGLAAAGARDDERRFERRLDDGLLLVGGPRQAEDVGDLDRRAGRPRRGGASRPAHELTSPTTWMRHEPPWRPSQ